MHTRLFGTTNLSAALPPWALDGDKAAIAARLRSPSTRREMKTYESIITALARGDWNRIVIFHCESEPNWSRRSIAEIAEDCGRDPFDIVYDLLLAEIGRLHEVMVLALAYQEQDLRLAFAHAECMIGSDATALTLDGPLVETSFHRAYTWAAWFYRHFVCEQQSVTPQEAVRQLTSLPAARLRLADRGAIRVGVCADLAIFDPDNFAEYGTMFGPNQLTTGMRHVVVNGVVALRNGRLASYRGG